VSDATSLITEIIETKGKQKPKAKVTSASNPAKRAKLGQQ